MTPGRKTMNQSFVLVVIPRSVSKIVNFAISHLAFVSFVTICCLHSKYNVCNIVLVSSFYIPTMLSKARIVMKTIIFEIKFQSWKVSRITGDSEIKGAKMSGHRRIRKTRVIRASHFVEEVPMYALNDPLPPYHPGTPPPQQKVRSYLLSEICRIPLHLFERSVVGNYQ